MPTAAIYARQSFFKEDSCSIDMQIERAKAFCVSQGWDYVIYDTDKGYSGKDTDRPGFRHMMKDIAAGKVQFVVVYKLDRISRNLRDFFDLMEQFKQRDVGFRSLTENFDTTTPMGRAMLAIIAVFAQLERETTAERVRDNMLDRARMGIWNGGPIPFGFITEKTTLAVNGKQKEFSVLAPEAGETDWVRKFYAWYLEPNGSIRSNVFRANQLVIPTKTGKAWNPNQMQRILSNPLYCVADQSAWEYFSSLGAQMASDQSEFDGQHGLMWYNRRKPHGKTTRMRDQSDWVLAVGGHLGTISGEIFVQVQQKLAAKAERPARAGTGKKGLLAYLVKCGKCNKSMIYSDYQKSSWQYYRCRAKEMQGPAVCEGQTVKGNELEEAVIKAIKQVCADRAFLEGVARQSLQSVGDNSQPLLEEKNRLAARLDKLASEQKELVRALGKKTLPVELIEERIQEIERDKSPIIKRLTEVESELESQDWQKIDMETVFGNLLRFNEVFDELEFEEKRNFLRSIVKEIIYCEGQIRIVLYFMPEITSGKPSGDNSVSDTSVMNPCPCGFYGSDIECNCTPVQIQRYLSRISGPLLDRMDLHVEVARVRLEELQGKSPGEDSATMRERIKTARDIQKKRFGRSKISLNSQMRPADVRKHCRLDEASQDLMKNVFDRLNFSARSYDRVLKVARTIADLEQLDNIQLPHLAEALQYRSLDRKYWGK